MAAGGRGETLDLLVRHAGKPAAGAMVRVLPLTESGGLLTGGTGGELVTGADGRAFLAGLDPGPYRLIAARPGSPKIERDVHFPAAGPLRGILDLPGRGPAAELTFAEGPRLVPAGREVELTLRVTDRWGQPALDGTPVKLFATDGEVLVGRARGSWLTAPANNGRVVCRLSRRAPGRAALKAVCGDLEATVEISYHGPLATLILGQGPREAANRLAHPLPGCDLPLLVAVRDAGGRGVPGAPFRLWYRPMPDGETSVVTGVTGPTGDAVVTGRTDDAWQVYRVRVQAGGLEAIREFRLEPPPWPWVEAKATWRGRLGTLTCRLHQPGPGFQTLDLTLTAGPGSRLLVLDELGRPTGSLTVDGENQATATLVRLAPGPAALTVAAPGVWPTWLDLDAEAQIAPADEPVATEPELPEPAWVLDAAPPRWPAPERVAGLAPAELGNWYRLGPSPARLLLEGGQRLSPWRPLSGSPGVVAAWREASAERWTFHLRTHRFGLGETRDETWTAEHPALLWGVDAVLDVAADGRRALIITAPLPTTPPRRTLWVVGPDRPSTLVTDEPPHPAEGRFVGERLLLRAPDGALTGYTPAGSG